ncbi:MAG: hypothetical protein ACTS42_02070, partial [Candidatus Hodgkinia cicadicola]
MSDRFCNYSDNLLLQFLISVSQCPTFQAFNKKTTVGKIYIFKLNHMVEDKMYFRSTGPYSSLTQQ